MFVVLLGRRRRREWYLCYSETQALCVPLHLAFYSFCHNSGLCRFLFINNRRSQHLFFLFSVCVCGKKNKTEKVRRTQASSTLSRHGTCLTVPSRIHETREFCIAAQHRAFSPSHFLLDYFLPSFPSLVIFIWTGNFLNIPVKSSSKKNHLLVLQLTLDFWHISGRMSLFDDMGCSVCILEMTFMTLMTIHASLFTFTIVTSGHDNLHLCKEDCTKTGRLKTQFLKLPDPTRHRSKLRAMR